MDPVTLNNGHCISMETLEGILNTLCVHGRIVLDGDEYKYRTCAKTPCTHPCNILSTCKTCDDNCGRSLRRREAKAKKAAAQDTDIDANE
ncbi:hypothetical protein KIPB_011815 [Kipferlia bialata]|uniref:Uncharacterized protein n=1 Tax=Kipferlia bialata TaxID=797122 RepID=A0A391NQU4_9EUKA|nr:hypothetical protein KIPB_011815 [Kipferlia bialata]|eukprot:g11815.t1